MKKKITCFCENAFDAEIPDEVDLDSGNYLEEIQNGSFLNFTCGSCGKKHKPEFPLKLVWPSKKLRFEVFTEMDKGEFYRRKKLPNEKLSGEKASYPLETIIGFPEMADRLAVIKDGFEPAAVEAIKYYLYLKADEQYPDTDLSIWYFGQSGDTPDQRTLEFHIHGIREGEVAVMKIPFSLYEKTFADFKKNPKSELFSTLRVRTYLSARNTMRQEQFM